MYVAAEAGCVDVASGEGVADDVAAAVAVGTDDGAEAGDVADASADGVGPMEAVEQAPSPSAAAMRTPESPQRRPLVRVIAEV